MTERTYYVCLDDRGLVDSSILFIRKAVMDYLQSSDESCIDIYSSASMKITIGSVMKMKEDDGIKGPKISNFFWRYESKGGVQFKRIMPNGALVKIDYRNKLLPILFLEDGLLYVKGWGIKMDRRMVKAPRALDRRRVIE